MGNDNFEELSKDLTKLVKKNKAILYQEGNELITRNSLKFGSSNNREDLFDINPVERVSKRNLDEIDLCSSHDDLAEIDSSYERRDMVSKDAFGIKQQDNKVSKKMKVGEEPKHFKTLNSKRGYRESSPIIKNVKNIKEDGSNSKSIKSNNFRKDLLSYLPYILL